MKLETIASISQAVASAGLIISLFLIWRQLRTQNFSHNLQSMEILREIWDSERQLRLRLAVATKLQSNRNYYDEDFGELLEIFERMGAYVRQGSISKELVWHCFSWYIEHYFEIARDGVLLSRKKYHDEFIFTEFFFLAREMKEITKKRNGAKITDEMSVIFLEAEIATAKLLLNHEQPDRK